MKDRDYKEVLENTSTPIVVIVSNEESSSKKHPTESDFKTSFSIHFVNETFVKIYGDLIKVGFTTEQCVERLSKEVDWYKMACVCTETGGRTSGNNFLFNNLLSLAPCTDERNKKRIHHHCNRKRQQRQRKGTAAFAAKSPARSPHRRTFQLPRRIKKQT